MDDYIELICKLPQKNQSAIEILIALLSEAGYLGFREFENSIHGYIDEEKFDEVALNQILKNPVFESFEIEFSFANAKSINWNEEWEKNFQPLIIQNKCLIKASFHDIEEKYPYIITIDPKMSFGTGHHASTLLMLELLIGMDLNQQSVLDMGCGTGILSIMAALKGAEDITAIDNSPWAYENTLENLNYNSITNSIVILGDSTSIPNILYHTILANINRNVIINEFENYVSHLRSDGILCLSGFFSDDFEFIHQEAIKHSLQQIETRQKNDWMLVVYKNTIV